MNLVFQDDICIEGVVKLRENEGSAKPTHVLVISQPFTGGTHPSEGQIENWMSSNGYLPEGDNSYYNPDIAVRVNSASPANFITMGNANHVPYDVTLESDFTVEELTELIGGN